MQFFGFLHKFGIAQGFVQSLAQGGYPLGRSGGKIPPEARLLAVVDAFDAMTFGRPFRRPLTVDAALAELDRCSGTQFEPAVVRAFVDAYDAGDVDLRRRAS